MIEKKFEYKDIWICLRDLSFYILRNYKQLKKIQDMDIKITNQGKLVTLVIHILED